MIISNDEILDLTKRFPKDFLEGLNTPITPLKEMPERVFYSGMGGSGVCGEVLKDILSYDNIPVYTNHNYGYFKGKFGDKDIHIFSSYSGNTEETLNAFNTAGNIRNRYIISSGGKLFHIANVKKLPILKQKEGYQPRLIFPFTLGLILKTLDYCKNHNCNKNKLVDKLSDILNKNNPVADIELLSNKLKDKFIVIYSSYNIHGVALRLSAQFNENAKLFTHTAFFSECNHNEILAIKHLSTMPVTCILLKSKFDNERIKLRMKILEGMMRGNGIDVNSIEFDADSVLDEIVSLIYFGDLLSVHTAIKRGVIAGDIEEIENLKRELSE